MKIPIHNDDTLSTWINSLEYDDYDVLWAKSITIRNLIEEAFPFEAQVEEKGTFRQLVLGYSLDEQWFELVIDRYLSSVLYNYIPEHAEYSDITGKTWNPISNSSARLFWMPA